MKGKEKKGKRERYKRKEKENLSMFIHDEEGTLGV